MNYIRKGSMFVEFCIGFVKTVRELASFKTFLAFLLLSSFSNCARSRFFDGSHDHAFAAELPFVVGSIYRTCLCTVGLILFHIPTRL
jgi:hypothetical protein